MKTVNFLSEFWKTSILRRKTWKNISKVTYMKTLRNYSLKYWNAGPFFRDFVFLLFHENKFRSISPTHPSVAWRENSLDISTGESTGYLKFMSFLLFFPTCLCNFWMYPLSLLLSFFFYFCSFVKFRNFLGRHYYKQIHLSKMSALILFSVYPLELIKWKISLIDFILLVLVLGISCFWLASLLFFFLFRSYEKYHYWTFRLFLFLYLFILSGFQFHFHDID